MRNAIVLPLMFATSLLTPRISSSPGEPIFVSGLVTDARTGEPIEGVRIILESERIAVETNREGKFGLPSSVEASGLELKLVHPCYHTVRVEVGSSDALEGTGQSGAAERIIRLGLPFNSEKYGGYAPPLGGCH